MKTIFKLPVYILCTLALILNSCSDSAFESLNTNPSKSTDVDPNYQFSQCEAQVWGYWIWQETALKYAMPFCQYLMGDWGITNYGGHYLKDTQYTGYVYEQMYPMVVKNLVDVINRTGTNNHRNLHYMSRVFKVYVSGILTDLYGDVPYFEAGRGYIDNNVLPKFDTQEEIYKDFMKELQIANDSLDASQPIKVTGDIIYNGDIGEITAAAGTSIIIPTLISLLNSLPSAVSSTLHSSSIAFACFTSSTEAIIGYMM